MLVQRTKLNHSTRRSSHTTRTSALPSHLGGLVMHFCLQACKNWPFWPIGCQLSPKSVWLVAKRPLTTTSKSKSWSRLDRCNWLTTATFWMSRSKIRTEVNPWSSLMLRSTVVATLRNLLKSLHPTLHSLNTELGSKTVRLEASQITCAFTDILIRNYKKI